MNENRNIRLSVRKETEDQLRLMGYDNIYTESDMRNRTTATSPYIYVVDRKVAPMETTLPFIVIEVAPITKKPFELGNRSGRLATVLIHIFGKNRGQRDDIGAYLQDNLPSKIKYYDFGSSYPVEGDFYIQVGDEMSIEDSPNLSDDLFTESSLDNWVILSFECSLTQ